MEYKNVRASEFKSETQLDRIEKKMDRIIHLLGSEDLSILESQKDVYLGTSEEIKIIAR